MRNVRGFEPGAELRERASLAQGDPELRRRFGDALPRAPTHRFGAVGDCLTSGAQVTPRLGRQLRFRREARSRTKGTCPTSLQVRTTTLRETASARVGLDARGTRATSENGLVRVGAGTGGHRQRLVGRMVTYVLLIHFGVTLVLVGLSLYGSRRDRSTVMLTMLISYVFWPVLVPAALVQKWRYDRGARLRGARGRTVDPK